MGQTIKSTAEIDRVFKTGRRVATPRVTVLAISSPGGRGLQGRVAFVAGRRLGGAVARNRAKRVLRAAVRREGGPWKGMDVCLLAREATSSASPGQLDADLRSALEQLGVDK